MRILVYIALVFFILLHKKKREKSCMQVPDRFIFGAGVVCGSEVSQRHLKVAPAGSEVMGATPRSRSRFRRCLEKTITSERGLGARSKGRSSWERHYGSDTLTSLAFSTERALKN